MYLLFLFLKCNLSMCVLLFIKYPIWFILTWKSHEHVEESVSSSCQPRNGSSERWRAVLKPYPGICRATPTPWCGDLTLGISGRNFLLHVFREEHHLWGCVWGGGEGETGRERSEASVLLGRATLPPGTHRACCVWFPRGTQAAASSQPWSLPGSFRGGSGAAVE